MTEPGERTKLDRERALESAPPWLRKLVWVLDDLVKIPGTDRGIGLDAIAGLVPGAGDTITSLLSVVVLLAAVRRGVPAVVVARMLMNIVVDGVVGSIPVLGDLFDVFFRSNRRNLALLERHADPEREPGAADYAVLGVGLTLVLALLALPFVLGVWLFRQIAG